MLVDWVWEVDEIGCCSFLGFVIVGFFGLRKFRGSNFGWFRLTSFFVGFFGWLFCCSEC